jgi:MFS family permease
VPRAPLFGRPFLLASLAVFLCGLALHPYVHLPGLLERYHADELTTGTIVALMSVSALLVRPLVGRMMDARGRRIVIVAGGVLQLIACLLYTLVDRVGWLLVVARLVHGLAEGALFASLFTYAADVVPVSRRTEGLGLFAVAGMLPVSLGGLLGDVILAHASYRALFLVTAGLSALALLAALALPEPPREAGPREPARGGLLAVLALPALLPLWVSSALVTIGTGAVFTFLKPFVEREHLGSVTLFVSAYAIAAITLRVFFGRLPDAIGRVRVLYPSLLALAGAVALTSIARTNVMLVAAGTLAGLGQGLSFPVLTSLVIERAPEERRGSAMAALTAVFDGSQLISGPLFGSIALATNLRTTFACAALMPLFGALSFFLLERRGTVAEEPKIEPQTL